MEVPHQTPDAVNPSLLCAVKFFDSELVKCFGLVRCECLLKGLVEGVWVRPDHHDHFFQRIGSSSELSPVDSVLVSTPIVSTSVPNPVQIWMGTRVVPPASLLVMGTVTWRSVKNNSCHVVCLAQNIACIIVIRLSGSRILISHVHFT